MIRLRDFFVSDCLTAESIEQRFGKGFLVLEGIASRPNENNRDIFKTLHGSLNTRSFGEIASDLFRDPEEAPVYQLAQPGRSKFMLTLGRAGSVDIHIDHSTVSKLHAWFRHEPDCGKFWVADAGSTNGTKLTMKPLRAHEAVELIGGETLTFGTRITARFHTPRTLAVYLTIVRRIGSRSSASGPRLAAVG